MYLILITIRKMNTIKSKKQENFLHTYNRIYSLAVLLISTLRVLSLFLSLNYIKKSKSWVTRILLFEELFHYQYPFKYPDLFETENNKLTKDQYLVRFEFIRVFSIKSATKHFYLREFFQQHPVSNKRIHDMKQIFIELIREFYQIGLINFKVKLILHNNYNYLDIENLTTFNISDGFILYEKIYSK